MLDRRSTYRAAHAAIALVLLLPISDSVATVATSTRDLDVPPWVCSEQVHDGTSKLSKVFKKGRMFLARVFSLV